MSTTTVVGGALGAILVVLAALHVFWAFGGAWGAGAAVPEIKGRPSFAPTRAATLAVSAALAAAAVAVLARADLMLPAVPRWVSQWAVAGLGAVFVLRSVGEFRVVGFFKAVTGTRFARWDTWLYSPLSLLLGLGALWLAYR